METTASLANSTPEPAPIRAFGYQDGGIFIVSDHINSICKAVPVSINAVVSCLFFVTLIGLVGNFCVLFVVGKNKALQNAPNILIVNIAVADIIYIASTAPFYMQHEFHRPCWLHSEVSCKIRHYIPVVAQGVCVFSVVALSRERFTAIVRGLESRVTRTRRRTFLATFATWFLGNIIAVPVLFVTETTVFNLNCVYMPKRTALTRSYTISLFALLYLIPLLITSVHYYAIVKKLISNRNTRVLCTNVSSNKQLRVRKRLALMVMTITIFFGVFWFPHFTYMMWFLFTTHVNDIFQNKPYVKMFRHFNYYMALANSCLNPFIVFTMSTAFRHTLFAMCRLTSQPLCSFLPRTNLRKNKKTSSFKKIIGTT